MKGFLKDSLDCRWSFKMKSFLLCTIVFTSLLPISFAQVSLLVSYFFFLVGVIFFLIFLSELLWKKLIPHHSVAFKQSKTLSDWKCLIFWFSEEAKSHFPMNFHLNVFPLQCLSLWQVTPTTKNICFHFF